MKKYRNYLLVTGLIGILALAFFPLRNYYFYLKEPDAILTDAIPPESAIIIKTASLDKLIRVLRSSEIFDILESKKTKYGIECLTNTVNEISKKSSFFRGLTENNEMMICFVPDKDMNPEILFLAVTGKLTSGEFNDQLEELLPQGSKIERIKNTPANLYRISTGKNEIWCYYYRGILALAYNRQILELSCSTTAQDKNLMDQPEFARLTKSSGKRVDGVMMLNNKKLAEVFLRISADNPLEFSGSPFNGWTSLDLHIKKDRILLDGFTAARNDSTLFTGQSPAEIDHMRYFPTGTAFALSLSISNQKKYTSAFFKKDTLHFAGYDSINKTTSKEIFRPEEHLRAWIGNSVSFIAMPAYFAGESSEYMVMIGLKSKDSAVELLKPFFQPYKDEIKIFTAENLAGNLWGNLFGIERRQYCLLTDQMLAISPSDSLLSIYAREASENRLLGSTALYEEATGFLLEKSNISVYMIPAYCKSFPDWDGNKRHSIGKSEKWSEVPASTRFIGMQISADGPLLFTHAFALLNNESGRSPLAVHENKSGKTAPTATPTDSKVAQPREVSPASDKNATNSGSGKLLLISGNKSKDNQILVADKNTITAISDKGDKIWSFTCKGQPAEKVYEIRITGEPGKQFLIATETHLHIINQKGNELKNSPLMAPGGIRGDISLFDYDRKNDYRILYAGNDNKIHNLSINSREPADWQKPIIKNGLNTLQFFRTQGRDYIAFADNKGKVSVIDRKGNQRIKVDEGFKKSNGSPLFENKSNSKGIFLMASASGNLAYLDTEGRISESQFGAHGNNPWFDYLDFNGDGNIDFIFCGEGEVTVYSRMKKVIVSASLKDADFSKPFIFSPGTNNWLAVRDRNSGKIITLNSRNQAKTNNPIYSDTNPLIIIREGEKKPVLVTISGGKTIFTPLE